jgi:farnesyl-diphosphate farnesyltransferase
MADLHDLLVKTSRTFALSIPYLPEPTRQEVTVAYLLFRIADTFEDAASWPQVQRVAALAAFQNLLGTANPEETRRLATEWSDAVPIDHAGYQELMKEVPFVLDAFFKLSPTARECVREHTCRTARGMAAFVERTDPGGELELRDLDDLKHYCYIVAGIVGEMLTELFLLDNPLLDPIAADLRRRSRSFGEALQLVNILKDAAFDATEGRSYLPPSTDRDQIFGQAKKDLGNSIEYVHLLQRGEAHRGVVAFNAVQVLLAREALTKVEREGPGAKISRPRVFWLLKRLERDLEKDRPAIPTE